VDPTRRTGSNPKPLVIEATQAGLGTDGKSIEPSDLKIETLEGDEARDSTRLAAACERIFPGFDLGYLIPRLATVSHPALICASHGGTLLGFKLGYRRGASLFYSWLGGIDPNVRRLGLARRLMAVQHDWARAAGYTAIETRTRAANNAMIVLNLRHGFVISGYETDGQGIAVVTQRKQLR
jgi:GNAT superfamily N-acetyltransferase